MRSLWSKPGRLRPVAKAVLCSSANIKHKTARIDSQYCTTSVSSGAVKTDRGRVVSPGR
jgi:hypothetical protein